MVSVIVCKYAHSSLTIVFLQKMIKDDILVLLLYLEARISVCYSDGYYYLSVDIEKLSLNIMASLFCMFYISYLILLTLIITTVTIAFVSVMNPASALLEVSIFEILSVLHCRLIDIPYYL